jgi:saccharopine dehydrogenase-like NADP-dependent oxidoreductase
MRETIGFIGAGNMGKAMIEGICQNHVFNTVWVCDHHQENLDVLHEKYGVKTSLSEIEVAQNSDVLVLSVKPKHYPKVIETIKDSVKSDVIIVDIAAGVTILDVKTYFGSPTHIILHTVHIRFNIIATRIICKTLTNKSCIVFVFLTTIITNNHHKTWSVRSLIDS